MIIVKKEIQHNQQLVFSKRGESLVGQEMFKVLDLAKNLESRGRKVIHLELGDPVLYPPGRVVNETIISLLNSELGYTSSSGLYQLRKGITEHINNELSVNKIDVGNVVISVANLLISQVLDIICDRNDKVGLFLPAFPTYFAASSYIGLDITSVNVDMNDGFMITRSVIDELFSLKPKVIIVNSGNNPTGAVYKKEMLEHLLECAILNDTWIVSDETYSKLSFADDYISFVGRDYNKLIVISSFSKVFNIPGYRVGYAVADPEVCKKISLSSSTLYSCLPIFTQKGITKGLSILDEFADEKKIHYESLLRSCVLHINKSLLLECMMPESAFYLFIDISRTGLDDKEFCMGLLDKYAVAVTPGSSFGCSKYVRASVTGKDDEVIEGMKKIVLFADEYLDMKI